MFTSDPIVGAVQHVKSAYVFLHVCVSLQSLRTGHNSFCYILPMFAEHRQDIKDAIAGLLSESGSTALTWEDVFERVERYTAMPLDLWPHEPFGPYVQAVKDALDSCFEGKCALVQLSPAYQHLLC